VDCLSVRNRRIAAVAGGGSNCRCRPWAVIWFSWKPTSRCITVAR